MPPPPDEKGLFDRDGKPPRKEKGPGALAGATEATIKKPGGFKPSVYRRRADLAISLDAVRDRRNQERERLEHEAQGRLRVLTILYDLRHLTGASYLDERIAAGFRPMLLLEPAGLRFVELLPPPGAVFDLDRAKRVKVWGLENTDEIRAELFNRGMIFRATRSREYIHVGFHRPALKLSRRLIAALKQLRPYAAEGQP